MFERFGQRSRQVLVHAQQAARELGHDHIGTEHLLLGLLRERDGIAARVLAGAGITEETVRAEIERAVGSGEEGPAGRLPFTPHLTEVIDRAPGEALSLGRNDVETEDLLLGLLRESDGLGAQILRRLDADADLKLRNSVIQALSGLASPWTPAPRRRDPGDLTVSPGWLEGVAPLLDGLTDGIRAHHRREPDSGDLIIALNGTSKSQAAHVLSELGIDAEQLAGAVARARSEGAAGGEDAIEQTRQRKETARERAVRAGQRTPRRGTPPHPGTSFTPGRGARRDSSTSRPPRPLPLRHGRPRALIAVRVRGTQPAGLQVVR